MKDLALRYLLLLTPISLWYFIFTPLTIYGSYLSLLFYNPVISGDVITIRGMPFTFIDACIAAYAYWLLWFLILTTRDVRLLIRIKVVLFGSLLILAMNYFRIWLLIVLTVEYGFGAFDLVHMVFYKFISWVYVALVWIFLIRVYKIRSIPVYSDFKYLYKNIKKH